MLFEAREMIIENEPTVNIYRNKLLIGSAVKVVGIFFFYDLFGQLVATGPNLYHLMLGLSIFPSLGI
jgi:hypothetical protein